MNKLAGSMLDIISSINEPIAYESNIISSLIAVSDEIYDFSYTNSVISSIIKATVVLRMYRYNSLKARKNKEVSSINIR
jgi:hypothetical protein